MPRLLQLSSTLLAQAGLCECGPNLREAGWSQHLARWCPTHSCTHCVWLFLQQHVKEPTGDIDWQVSSIHCSRPLPLHRLQLASFLWGCSLESQVGNTSENSSSYNLVLTILSSERMAGSPLWYSPDLSIKRKAILLKLLYHKAGCS